MFTLHGYFALTQPSQLSLQVLMSACHMYTHQYASVSQPATVDIVDGVYHSARFFTQ